MADESIVKFIPQTNREKELFQSLDLKKLPRHVAIIMDGNGRWAKMRGFASRINGHRAGIQSVRNVSTTCAKFGIEVLTLYAFSMENWNRPKREINALMHLLNEFLIEERPTLKENNVRLIASGRLNMLPEKTQTILKETISFSSNFTGLILNLSLSYGGQQEIIDSALKLHRALSNKEINEDEVTQEVFSKFLYQPTLPEPDLLIRTSGELRISNFLLWQIAYTEIYITSVLWPDFSSADLLEAFLDFQKRERRFGRVFSSGDAM